MRGQTRAAAAQGGAPASRGARPRPAGIEWAHRRVGAAAGVITLAGVLMAPGLAPSAGASAVQPGPAMSAPVRVIVSAAQRPDHYDPSLVGNVLATIGATLQRNATTHTVHQKVTAVAGDVQQDVDAANAVVAEVTPNQLLGLQADPSLVVTPDVSVAMQDTPTTDTPTRAPADVYPDTTGASTLWNYGVKGNGVTVAVLDTGIQKLGDFKHLMGGVDLSGEGNPFNDSYGHGTFVAGLIAGNGNSSKGQYTGEAPEANLVAIKVAGASGETDLATVIQGINWAVANQAKYKIRVLNLSLGAIPTSSTVTNPLDQAVESAWQAGITVVASAGNSGPFNGTITSPGDDPLVITVGSVDDNGTVDPSDDSAADFSSVGPTAPDGWFKPDIVTSGRSVVSLRAPGSTIDTTYPSAEIGNSNFVGSGTSFSAAITSGAAALVIQADHDKRSLGAFPTPDTVKAQLLATASSGPVGNPMVDGHGDLNVLAAAQQPGLQLTQTIPTAGASVGDTVDLGQTWKTSTWNPSAWVGSTTSNGLTLTLQNIGNLLAGLTGTDSSGTSSGPATNGSSWNGSSWNSSSWNGSSWNGSSWNGSSWNGSSWNGSSWNGSSWNGSSWNGSSWNGSSWNGSSWNGSSWNGSSWNGSSWNGSSWH